MTDDQTRHRRPRFWIILVAIAVALIFLYFYQPFQDYLAAAIPNVHFSNVLFWFASWSGWSHTRSPTGSPSARTCSVRSRSWTWRG